MALTFAGEDFWANLQFFLLSLLVVVLAITVTTLAPYAFASSRPANYPPGPPTVPFLGNLHLLPPTKAFVQ